VRGRHAGYSTPYHGGYVPLLVYTILYHPGYTLYTPSSSTRDPPRGPEDSLAALTRGVTERTVRHAGVTVRGCYRDPFHCWVMLRSMLRRVPGMGPQAGVREIVARVGEGKCQ